MKIYEQSGSSLHWSAWSVPAGTAGSYPPASGADPVVDNPNSNLYIELNGIKYYNSAIYERNSEVWIFAFFATNNTALQVFSSWSSSWSNYYSHNCTGQLGTGYTDTNNIGWSTVDGKQMPRIAVLSKSSISGQDFGIPHFTDATECYNYMTTNAVTYTWQSVPSISGKNGILSLATIDSSIIDPWNTQKSSSDDSKFGLPSQANLLNFLQNLEDNVETTVIYCGDNYLTLKRVTTTGNGYIQISGNLRLYFAGGRLIYSHTFSGYFRDSTNLTMEYLGFIIDEENQVANLDGVTADTLYSTGVTSYTYNQYTDTTETELGLIYTWLQGGNKDNESPYEEGTTDNGGTDGYVTPQDSLPKNSLPSVDGCNTGMFTIWKPSDADILHISSFLWSTDVIDNIRKYFNNVGDCVLGLYILPYVPDTGISSKKFQIGNMVDNDYTNVDYLTSRYREVDMGSFDLSSIWDTYLDFAPYTKLEVFLPYCGLHQLDVDELMCPAKSDGNLGDTIGSTIKCIYRLDLLTGGVVVYLMMNDEVRYQFSGKMGCQLPVTGNNYATMVQTLIQGISGLASTVVSHGISAPYAQNPVAPTPPSSGASKSDVKQYTKDLSKYNKQMESRATSIGHTAGVATGAAVSGTVASMKPDIIKCGNISGDLSMLGYDRPYLIKTRPNKPKLEGQGQFTGYPSYKSGKVGDFTGYTECIKVHLEGLSCTGKEQEDIETMLQNGVIITPINSRTPTPDVTPVVSGNLVLCLLKMTSEVNVLGKKWDTTNILKIEGKLVYDQSVSNPVILIEGDCMGYNYCYVPFFHRFYYIGDYVVTRQDLQELHLTVDVLQSFASDIDNSDCIVSRSTSNPNYYINDGVFYTEQRMVVTYHCFKNEGQIKKFDTQQLYLVTAGG